MCCSLSPCRLGSAYAHNSCSDGHPGPQEEAEREKRQGSPSQKVSRAGDGGKPACVSVSCICPYQCRSKALPHTVELSFVTLAARLARASCISAIDSWRGGSLKRPQSQGKRGKRTRRRWWDWFAGADGNTQPGRGPAYAAHTLLLSPAGLRGVGSCYWQPSAARS